MPKTTATTSTVTSGHETARMPKTIWLAPQLSGQDPLRHSSARERVSDRCHPADDEQHRENARKDVEAALEEDSTASPPRIHRAA